MSYITLLDMIRSLIHFSTLVRADKFMMASKMAAVFRRTGLSLGSLQWIFDNRVKVKITCACSLINIRILNE